MSGTLLVYDDAFPRASGKLKVSNRPSAEELKDNRYPAPHALLAIPIALTIDEYLKLIVKRIQRLGGVKKLIIFGHGEVVKAARGKGSIPVTVGIVMGATNIRVENADKLKKLRKMFLKGGSCELWVCNAADPTEVGGVGGVSMCQAICDALQVSVYAADVEQEYESTDQVFGEGSVSSTAKFLPWEGTLVRFDPRVAR